MVFLPCWSVAVQIMPGGLWKAIVVYCFTGETLLPFISTTSASFICLERSLTAMPLTKTLPSKIKASALRLLAIPQCDMYWFIRRFLLWKFYDF